MRDRRRSRNRFGASWSWFKPIAVDVVHEELVAVLLRPGSAEIDHRPGVGVPAADVVAAVAVRLVPLIADPVTVLGDRLNVGVRVRVEVLARLPLIAAPGMTWYRCGMTQQVEKALPAIVEVDAPGITRAVCEDLELVPRRVIPPDAGVDRRAFFVRRARLADARMREDAVTAVKPAVRPPDEAVERFVRVLVVPAVEQHLRLAIGHVIAVRIGYEEQFRSLTDPHAAEADLQPADEIQLVEKDFLAVELSVAVRRLRRSECDLRLALFSALRIDESFGDPQTATIVDRHRDRLTNIGLAGEQRRLEARGQVHRRGGFFRWQSMSEDLAFLHRELRPLLVEAEVIEVDVPPAARNDRR